MTKQEAKTLEAIDRQCKAANCGCVHTQELERIARELRTYNPAADEYKGEHIHKVWAREIEALLAAAPAAPPEGARVCIGEPDYKARFETMVYMIGEITQALGISDDEAACANGNDVILNAIRELKGERDNFADDAYALAGEGARDAGVGAAIYQLSDDGATWVDTDWMNYQSTGGEKRIVYAHPDPLLAEAVEALREISEQADDSYALGSGNHRRVTLGRIHERARSVLAKARAAKEQAS